MKVYISGKMTGLSEEKIWNNFRKVETFLIKANPGGVVEGIINPSVTYAMQKFDAFSYEDWMHIDFAMLDVCDAVFLLPNWRDSMGAKLEIAYAYKHGKKVFYPSYGINCHLPSFKFDGEKYNHFSLNLELTKQIALEVEKYDVKKQLDEIIDSFCEEKAKKSLEEQWINMNL